MSSRWRLRSWRTPAPGRRRGADRGAAASVVRYTTASIGSALSVIATRLPGGIVGVAAEPASSWLGLGIPELR